MTRPIRRDSLRSGAGKGADLSRHRGFPGRGCPSRSPRGADRPPRSGRDHRVERHRLRLQSYHRALRRARARLRRGPHGYARRLFGTVRVSASRRVSSRRSRPAPTSRAGRYRLDAPRPGLGRPLRGSFARDGRAGAPRRGQTISAEAGEDRGTRAPRASSDPDAFCAYCLRDSELVLRILAETGLDELTARRAALTGVSLELAWTSIPAFERVYGAELRARRIAVPAKADRRVSGRGRRHGARGERRHVPPRPGLRLPQPLPVDHADLQHGSPRPRAGRGAGRPGPTDIVAPNGARFDRSPGVLPSLIAEYSTERERALAEATKWRPTSTRSCRIPFTACSAPRLAAMPAPRLAGAITSFGKKFLVDGEGFLRGQGQARPLWRHGLGLRALGRRRSRGLRDAHGEGGRRGRGAQCRDRATHSIRVWTRVSSPYPLREGLFQVPDPAPQVGDRGRGARAFQRLCGPPRRPRRLHRGRGQGHGGGPQRFHSPGAGLSGQTPRPGLFGGRRGRVARIPAARRLRPCAAASGTRNSCTARTSGASPTITPRRRPR